MVKDHAFLVDATCGVAADVNSKRVFYYAGTFYDRDAHAQAVPVLQILTYKPNEETLKEVLINYMDSIGKRANLRDFLVPLLAVCDLSWPTVRALIYAFNGRESLEEYINRSFSILTG